MYIQKTIPAIAACAVVAGLLAGCGFTESLTGSAPVHDPMLVTVVVGDISGSTFNQRDAYVDDAVTAITATAEQGGAVYVGTVDGLATDDGWPIADRRFSTSVGGGNKSLATAARAHQAERLRPQVNRLLHGRGQGGSDLLEMLVNVRRLLCTLPKAERRLVVISDGAVVAGGVDLYGKPPRTERARARLIRHLRRSGEIPADLGCGKSSPVRVWLSGLGVGISRRDVALAVRRFFVEVIESTGAVVVAEGPQLLARTFGENHIDANDGGRP